MTGDARYTARQVTVREWGSTTANVTFTDINTGKQGDNNTGTKYVFTSALENGADGVANNNTFQIRGREAFLRTYIDNAAAAAAGLPIGIKYKTSTGDVKVRY